MFLSLLDNNLTNSLYVAKNNVTLAVKNPTEAFKSDINDKTIKLPPASDTKTKLMSKN